MRKDDEVTVVRGTYKVYVPDRWTVGPLLTFQGATQQVRVPSNSQCACTSFALKQCLICCREGKERSFRYTGRSGSSTSSGSPGRRSTVGTILHCTIVMHGKDPCSSVVRCLAIWACVNSHRSALCWATGILTFNDQHPLAQDF